MSLLSGPGGDISSKRVSALALIASGIVLAFLQPAEVAMVSVLIGAGTGILGVQAFTKS
jgi:hypothetical protein